MLKFIIECNGRRPQKIVKEAVDKAVEAGVPLDELEAEFNRWLAQKGAPRGR